MKLAGAAPAEGNIAVWRIVACRDTFADGAASSGYLSTIDGDGVLGIDAIVFASGAERTGAVGLTIDGDVTHTMKGFVRGRGNSHH